MRPDRFEEPYFLLRELGIFRAGEIDVEAIAEFCGATVVYDRLHGCQASLVGRLDRAIITVNRDAPRELQRFSAAHELGHWLLDRGQSAFACTGDMMEVEWWDEEGEEVLVSPEHRANDWAGELLIPDTFMMDMYDHSDPEVTFAAARELAERFRVDLRLAAMRMVATSPEIALLISSRPGQPSGCLKRSVQSRLDRWLRPSPGPGSVAHGLLNGSCESDPAPEDVVAEEWIDRPDAWWFTVHEESTSMPDGEVLTLLWWPWGTQNEIALQRPDELLETKPGRPAIRRLMEALCKDFGYRPVWDDRDEVAVVTGEPSPHRLEMPDLGNLDGAAMRALVDEVARHKGVHREEIMSAMVDW